jgi:hypothetical protein
MLIKRFPLSFMSYWQKRRDITGYQIRPIPHSGGVKDPIEKRNNRIGEMYEVKNKRA